MRRVHDAILATHPFYACWYNMHQRCHNPQNAAYKDYGLRGIIVCPEWGEFDAFYADMFATWAQGLEIDRIDNNGPYSPANCRWVTRAVNCRNTRDTKLTAEEADYIRQMKGKKTNKALAAEFGISASHVCRIQNGIKWHV